MKIEPSKHSFLQKSPIAFIGIIVIIYCVFKSANKDIYEMEERSNSKMNVEFEFNKEYISKSQIKFVIKKMGTAETISYKEFLDYLINNGLFRKFFLEILKTEVPFPTFKWETRPISKTKINQPFEFIIIDSPHLKSIRPDTYSFREHFEKGNFAGTYRTFHNLGGDSLLIAPCPEKDEFESNINLYRYSSIGPFLKLSKTDNEINQVNDLLRQIGIEGLNLAKKSTDTFISTEGSGVYWLHFRFDPRPKYYSSHYRNS